MVSDKTWRNRVKNCNNPIMENLPSMTPEPQYLLITPDELFEIVKKTSRLAVGEIYNRVRLRPVPTTSAEQVLEDLHAVVRQLYDEGFKNPLITVECAIAYLKDPTVLGHPEKQKLRQRGREQQQEREKSG